MFGGWVTSRRRHFSYGSSLWYTTLLFVIHLLLRDLSGAKFRKKSSIADSQETFAVIAGTLEELDAKLSLLKLQGRRNHPMILVVGEVINIKSVFVFFENSKYKFSKVIDAIDILFKLFFVFNIQFPEESEIFYNFLQTLFYNIPSSRKFVKVSAIKNEIMGMEV